MASNTEGQHAGEFILSEGNGNISRENVTVTVPAAGLPAGSVLGQVTSGGKYVEYDNAETDGRETAAAVLYNDFAAADVGDQPAAVVARLAEVRRSDLKYKDGTSAGDKTAAEAELLSSLIVVRD